MNIKGRDLFCFVFQFPIKLLRGPSRDLDKVQRENDALTRRADNQEEEFKKQNETMKHELNEVRQKKKNEFCHIKFEEFFVDVVLERIR